ncbi:Protein of uncharacterised function (DUF1482) [Raoultella terrigena]|uniref:Protein of uncharacterized function (DUF1482) n=1 Tax=Raoultella terrigena TaxID=577 RepID=A0A4U9CRH4_RAOTE|nr:Protein of uncharacterised function (DUF1482) [Raoultella terrigena]
MVDYARQPARQQAVRLTQSEALARRVCYLIAKTGSFFRRLGALLAQKGDPVMSTMFALMLTVGMLTGGNQDVLLGVYEQRERL